MYEEQNQYLHMHAIATPHKDVPACVCVDAIRQTVVAVSEQLPVAQALAVRCYVVAVHSGRVCIVSAVWISNKSRVGNVDVLVVRAELDTVDGVKSVCHSLHDTRKGLKPIDLLPNIWFGSESLPEGVIRVSKPEISGVGVLNNVVRRSKVAAEEVVDQNSASVFRRINEDQLSWVVEVALVTEDDGLAFAAVSRSSRRVISASAIGHGQVVVVQGLDRAILGVVRSDIDWSITPVARGVQLARFHVIDSGLVEGSPRSFLDQLLGDIGAKYIAQEGIVVRDELNVVGRVADGVKLVDVAEAGCQTQQVDFGDVHHFDRNMQRVELVVEILLVRRQSQSFYTY